MPADPMVKDGKILTGTPLYRLQVAAGEPTDAVQVYAGDVLDTLAAIGKDKDAAAATAAAAKAVGGLRKGALVELGTGLLKQLIELAVRPRPAA